MVLVVPCRKTFRKVVCMARRGRMNRRHSKKTFSRYGGAHPKNNVSPAGPMRGGIRL